ncbi:MaoC/PaaZ C-terminal domain-containing protein [Aestuariibacter sp. AA17]|uniref:MaoC/PaaZ C-terminal domain-containing protein n=1 Tax=Fluctibacter corallii TaxID=2984329 RepID=A0ABT3A4S8_9ALTE|nr:MaoC/PaaZ C-terminal domain-containing protein [Aestuariibacter sp. AA17]MCV2883252.1 MaoC/PaaZ C-terminal domain-containing protein [Aestuariibacter sp. AA17]
MNCLDAPTIRYQAMPTIWPLLLKSAVKRGCNQSQQKDLSLLPAFHCERVVFPAQRYLESVHKVLQYAPQAHMQMHPILPHFEAFKFHLAMMLRKEFPFSPMGVIHKRNSISVLQPITRDKEGELVCSIGQIIHVEKGVKFTINSNLIIDSKIAWKSVSTYFKRREIKDKLNQSRQTVRNDGVPDDANLLANMRFASNAGRQYARISGDYNPIHISAVMAQLFGFKASIAHGMYSKARLLSFLMTHPQGIKPQQVCGQAFKSFSIDVEFKQAIILPSTLVCVANTEKNSDVCEYSLSSKDFKRLHLRAKVLHGLPVWNEAAKV